MLFIFESIAQFRGG